MIMYTILAMAFRSGMIQPSEILWSHLKLSSPVTLWTLPTSLFLFLKPTMFSPF